MDMDTSYEPMDVDLSSNSIKSMDISYCESEEPKSRPSSPCEPASLLRTNFKEEMISASDNMCPPIGIENVQNVRKYHIVLQNNKQSTTYFMKFSVSVVLLLSIVIYNLNVLKCSDELDVQYIKENLSKKLYGQDRAIDLLAKSLEVKISSKILFLYGGTGVGKTYATSLMLEKVWNSSNVYHYTMPTFPTVFQNDLLLGLTFCDTAMLIVDDLTSSDMNVIEHIEKVIDKSNYLKKNVTVILIYNSDRIDKGFQKSSNAAFLEIELRDNFDHISAYKEFIKFEKLTEEHLKMCISTELGSSSPANIDTLLKNFNVSVDGCKGVYTKMKLLSLL